MELLSEFVGIVKLNHPYSHNPDYFCQVLVENHSQIVDCFAQETLGGRGPAGLGRCYI